MRMIWESADLLLDLPSPTVVELLFTDPRLEVAMRLSSTEAECIAAVTAVKTARYLRSMLNELGFLQLKPTWIYEDIASTINIVNARVSTERTCHIDIQFFAIQTWKEQSNVILHRIPGIINPSDDLINPLGWVLYCGHAPRLMCHYV